MKTEQRHYKNCEINHDGIEKVILSVKDLPDSIAYEVTFIDGSKLNIGYRFFSEYTQTDSNQFKILENKRADLILTSKLIDEHCSDQEILKSLDKKLVTIENEMGQLLFKKYLNNVQGEQ